MIEPMLPKQTIDKPNQISRLMRWGFVAYSLLGILGLCIWWKVVIAGFDPLNNISLSSIQSAVTATTTHPSLANPVIDQKVVQENLKNTKFSSHEVLTTFGPIDANVYANLRKQWEGVLNSNELQGDLLYKIAHGYDDRFLMTYANLNDDPDPAVILKSRYCDSDGCLIIVLKQIISGLSKGDYTYISRHIIAGGVGVTNEKICGFRALYDLSKVANGHIKAEPMLWLNNAKISCKDKAINIGSSDISKSK